MPLKVVATPRPSCVGVIPIRTELRLVLMIELLVVDRPEIPKTIVPDGLLIDNCP